MNVWSRTLRATSAANVTGATCFNLAVSREADRELVLHQPPWNSGLSTILDGSKLPWVDELRDKGELHTHKVRSTTISREIAVHGLAAVDLLKIDVEGHFMEVLEGIAPSRHRQGAQHRAGGGVRRGVGALPRVSSAPCCATRATASRRRMRRRS